MSETLNEAALRIAREEGLDRPQEFVALARRLSEWLAYGQEPAGWEHFGKLYPTKQWESDTPLYRHPAPKEVEKGSEAVNPMPTQEEVAQWARDNPCYSAAPKAVDELLEIAQLLYNESEEYDFDDGMGRGAPQWLWDKLAQVLEKQE